MLTTLDTVSIGRPIRRGLVTLYPLYTHTPASAPYLTGPEATAQGTIEVDEAPHASVPVLVAHNLADLPVLLLEGEGLLGGLQDRVLNATVLLATGTTRLPVSCVEAGRWRDGGGFARAGWHAPRRVKAAMSSSVTDSMRGGGTRHSDQGSVWHEVHRALDAKGLHSDTAALREAMMATPPSGRSPIEMAAAQLAKRGPLPAQTGVVAAVGSRLVMAELFDRPETLRSYWAGLIEALSVEPAGAGRAPRIDDALRFVRRLRHAERFRTEGVGLGVEHRFTATDQVGSALVWDDSVLHVSTYALAA